LQQRKHHEEPRHKRDHHYCQSDCSDAVSIQATETGGGVTGSRTFVSTDSLHLR
jgi:hypothetical protein